MKYRLLLSAALVLTAASGWAQRMRTTEWESGMLDKGKKTGVWEYYASTRDGKALVQKYDHSANKLLFYRPIEEIEYTVEAQPGQWSKDHVDQPPLYLGGEQPLAQFLASNLVYPARAQESKVQGKVVIAFAIDTLGHTSSHKVVFHVGGGCDEEALRVCRNIPNQWIPARKNGRAVAVQYELPVVFRLPN